MKAAVDFAGEREGTFDGLEFWEHHLVARKVDTICIARGGRRSHLHAARDRVQARERPLNRVFRT